MVPTAIDELPIKKNVRDKEMKYSCEAKTEKSWPHVWWNRQSILQNKTMCLGEFICMQRSLQAELEDLVHIHSFMFNCMLT